MCGIVGYTGGREAAPFLLSGLRALEYRGYDSAGLAVMGEGGLQLAKTSGRIERLAEKTRGGAALPGRSGIGHTRWYILCHTPLCLYSKIVKDILHHI